MKKKPKTSKIYARQGDVALLYLEAVPGAQKTGDPLPRERGAVVLAHGEVTGHSHRVRGQAQLYALEGNRITGEEAATAIARLGGGLTPDRLLEVKRATALVHEEHGKIPLAAGKMVVRLQEEYSPEELRNVQD